jgi:hypothetical protein
MMPAIKQAAPRPVKDRDDDRAAITAGIARLRAIRARPPLPANANAATVGARVRDLEADVRLLCAAVLVLVGVAEAGDREP